jgi:hypothetical protein
MKATGIVLAIVAGLLLAGGLFVGYSSYRNAGSAERLARGLPRDAAFVVRIVENKSKSQRNLALMLGAPGVVALGVGIALIRKGNRAA